MAIKDAKELRAGALHTQTDLRPEAVKGPASTSLR